MRNDSVDDNFAVSRITRRESSVIDRWVLFAGGGAARAGALFAD